MTTDDADSGLRLADLAAAFSLATDLGLGQPLEHVLRSWLIAGRMADNLDLGEDARAALFYVMTLAWAGCVADTPEVASWFGDDIAFRRDSYAVDLAGLPMMGFSLRHVGFGSRPLTRMRMAANLVVTGGKAVERGLMNHCLTTTQMAERLGLGREVCDPLRQVFTRWDAKGVPGGVGGEEITPLTRLFHLADIIEVHHRVEGLGAAVEVARSRRGKQFDPALVDAFCATAGDVLDGLDSVSDWTALIEREPGLHKTMTEDELDHALEAVADFTDLRSRSRSGHSRAVASLAAAAGELAGLPPGEVRNLRRAGHVHDVGMHGIPATILDKPGPLTSTEYERMRMYAYYTERTLARPAGLARIGAIAALATERCDGSGYHRGLSGSAIPAAGRILAAADAFHAMLEPRPHRPALSVGNATGELQAAVRAGKFAPDAAEAVLAAAGQQPGKRRSGPAGLTPREVEVLTRIARGASIKQVARALGITPKTAGTHVERIYAKIGASTRSTATLFAMQHGLLDTLDPLGL
jgi:HD-GYP domain-containing protein (c-di-GMP phosphodiesterase class II)